MKKKGFKKILAALMTAALILTNSGITFTSFASQKIQVNSISTNFQKASLPIGSTKQITTYFSPKNTTTQNVTYSSSNKTVASVSKNGLVTALSSGTANITVKTKGGKFKVIRISVLKDLIINKKSVKTSSKVTVQNKVYGNVIINNLIKNTTINLKNVNIMGTLTLQGGENYKVYLYNSSVNNAVVDKAQPNNKVVSMAVDTNTSAPALIVADNSKVKNINTYIDALISQNQNAVITTINVIQKYSNALNTVLDGYTGSLNVNAAANGQINTQFINSSVSDTVIAGGNDCSVNINTADTSKINSLTVNQQVNLNLGVPADNLHVSKDAHNSTLTITSPVGTLTNDGIDSRLSISSNVNNIVSTGSNCNISISKNGKVTVATLSGTSTSVTGSGNVATINVDAANCSINIENAAIKIGNFEGTLVNGKSQSANTSYTAQPATTADSSSSTSDSTSSSSSASSSSSTSSSSSGSSSSGSSSSGSSSSGSSSSGSSTSSSSSSGSSSSDSGNNSPDATAAPILTAGFEDSTMDNLAGTLGTGLAIVNGGYDGSSKCLQVTTASASWGTPGFDLVNYAGKTVTVIAYMKDPDASAQKVGFSLQLGIGGSTTYTYSGASLDASNGWTKFEYTYNIPSNATRAYLYFEKSWEQTVPTFYLDNVMIYPGTAAEADTAYSGKFSGSTTVTPATSSAISLKNAYSSYFKVGVAVNDTVINSSADTALVNEQYNSITAENAFKPDSLLNQSGSQAAADGMPVINYNRLDTYLGYAQSHSLKVRGHVLIWYSQTPTWFFREGYSATGNYVSSTVMLQRMESYIKQVLQYCQTKYPGVIYAWDVANEVVLGNDGTLRTDKNEWYNVFGNFSYVADAFKYARQYADPSIKLFYNDYNCYLKPNGILNFLAPIKAAGNIDGIGMQSHISVTFPDVTSIGNTIDAFATAGYEVQITELDMCIDSASDAALQAAKYQDLFNLFISKASKITSVTFWGLTDNLSWLSTKYPLLFNSDLSKKDAYYKVIAALTD